MDQRPERSTFLLYWCLACTASLLLSRVLFSTLYPAVPGVMLSGLIGVFMGAPLGLAQWWALRFPSAVQWVGFTTLGLVLSVAGSQVIGMHVGITGFPPLLWFVRAALLSIPIGYMQWLVLRKHVPRAAWWIPMSCVAWSLAGGARAVFDVGYVPIGQYLPDWVSLSIVLGIVHGLAFGAVSGVFMSRLLYDRDIPGTWIVRLFELK